MFCSEVEEEEGKFFLVTDVSGNDVPGLICPSGHSVDVKPDKHRPLGHRKGVTAGDDRIG